MLSVLNRFASAKTIQKELVARQKAVLQEARALVAQPAEAPDQAERLLKLGFTQANVVREADQDKRGILEMRIRMQADMALRYPGFRFVESEVMHAVCEKYKLVIGGVDRYLGDVPEFALRTIEGCGLLSPRYWVMQNALKNWFPTQVRVKSYLNEEDAKAAANKHNARIANTWEDSQSVQIAPEHLLLIAAPQKLMRLNRNEEVRGNRIVRRDPIVMIEMPEGYLVITAWDEEGRDPRILNASNN